MSGKLPAIQFYVGDWLRDPIAGCSLAAQGLWLRMMILAHDSDAYGRLEMNGKPLPAETIARRCGCSLAEFHKAFTELKGVGVPSLDENGVIFNRRMVRDHLKRKADRDRKREQRRAGKGTFARETGETVRPLSGACPEDVPSLSLRPSTSTSTSTSISTTIPPPLEAVQARAAKIGCKPEWAAEFFNHYESQGWLKANGLKITNWQISLKFWTEKNQKRPAPSFESHGAPTPASSAYALDVKAKAFREEMGKLERHRAEVAGGDFLWDDPKAKTRWFEVRKELASIAKEKQRI